MGFESGTGTSEGGLESYSAQITLQKKDKIEEYLKGVASDIKQKDQKQTYTLEGNSCVIIEPWKGSFALTSLLDEPHKTRVKKLVEGRRQLR